MPEHDAKQQNGTEASQGHRRRGPRRAEVGLSVAGDASGHGRGCRLPVQVVNTGSSQDAEGVTCHLSVLLP